MISLSIFVWSISEANPKNSWMRGEQLVPSEGRVRTNQDAAAFPAPADAADAAEKKNSVMKSKAMWADLNKDGVSIILIGSIIMQKERSGSSLAAIIKNHLGTKYKLDVAQKAGTLNTGIPYCSQCRVLTLLNTLFLVHLSGCAKGVFLFLQHRLTGRAPAASSSPPGRGLVWLLPGGLPRSNWKFSRSLHQERLGCRLKHLYTKHEIRSGWLESS